MGIVVAVAMLLGLLMLLPLPALRPLQHSMYAAMIVSALLMACGLWNSLYGLTHWQAFWGIAALVSGVVMILASFLTYSGKTHLPTWLAKVVLLKAAIITALLLCFGLYSVTLVQLNLGYPIIH